MVNFIKSADSKIKINEDVSYLLCCRSKKPCPAC